MATTDKVIRIKGKNGTVYLYEDKSYWDKERGYSTHRRKCIGKIGPDGDVQYNEYYRMRERLRAGEVKNVGPDSAAEEVSVSRTELMGERMVLDCEGKKTKVSGVIAKAFGEEDAARILALSYSLICQGKALSRAEPWLEDRGLGDLGLTTQRISELLGRITPERVNAFFAGWLGMWAKGGTLLFDITSVSTYGRRNEYSEWGYNRDRERLEQVNISLLSSCMCSLPLWYDVLPGSMADVTVLENVLETLTALGVPQFVFIGDRGFYSDKNLRIMLDKKLKFLIPVPSSVGHATHLIRLKKDVIVHPGNVMRDGSVPIYGMTVHERNGDYGKVWYHIYFDPMRKDKVIADMMERLNRCMDELTSGRRVETNQDLYDRFFIVKKINGRTVVKYNDDALRRFRESDSCYWVLMTNAEKDCRKALKQYRERGWIEQHFDDMKNLTDLRRMRSHSSRTFDGRAFVHFIALIILSQLRKDVDAIPAKDRRYMSATDMLGKVVTYQKVSFTGRRKAVWSTPTKAQRLVFDCLGIDYHGKKEQATEQVGNGNETRSERADTEVSLATEAIPSVPCGKNPSR